LEKEPFLEMWEDEMRKDIEMMMQVTDKELRQLRKWQTLWKAVDKAFQTDTPDVAELQSLANGLTGWVEKFPEHHETWKSFEVEITQQYKNMMRRYESLLREACKEAGYALTGEFPHFVVGGYIKVDLDTDKNQARINRNKTNSLSLPAVMLEIGNEHKRLWERKTTPAAFLDQVYDAYQVICQEKKITFGEYVPVKDVHAQLASTNKNYHLDMFAADLSQLLDSDALDDKEGNQLDLSPVRDSRKAVYLYNRRDQRGRYLGLLRFKPLARK
jgi:hypothetical protein